MPQKVTPHLAFTIQDSVVDYVDSFNILGIAFDFFVNLLIKLCRISEILHSLRNMFPVVILEKLCVS